MEAIKKLFKAKTTEKIKVEEKPVIPILAAVSLTIVDRRPPAYDVNFSSRENLRSGSGLGPRSEIEHGYGCYILNDPSLANSPDIEVDIVFIHGLRGNRFRTWAEGDFLWPRDLLLKEKSMKNARVITYGLDADAARFLDEVSQQNTFQHANQLLLDLRNIRKRKEEQERPIVFVAHSLGGIVVKMALNESKQSIECDHPNGIIYRCTQGVIFLGTPHRGSDAIALGIVIGNIAKVAFQQPNMTLLEELQHNSPTLMILSAAFSRMLYKKDLKVYSFVEELPIPGMGLIVDATSGFLDDVNEIKGMIHANHMDMVRFRDPNSDDYRRVLAAIEDLSESAMQAVKTKALPRLKTNDAEAREVNNNSGSSVDKSSSFTISFQIPYLRHQHFTGREQELNSMRNSLKVRPEDGDAKISTMIYGLVGTGGIGKTQLAIEYAYRYAEEYSGVFWVNGASEAEVNASYLSIMEAIIKEEVKKCPAAPNYLELAKRLDLVGALQEDGKLTGRGDSINRAVQCWLSSPGNKSWLLIFDNVDDLESFSVEKFFPKTCNGYILITSRRAEISSIATINDVDGMEPETAVELLLTSAGMNTKSHASELPDARKIVEHLGYMPLAIAHAGAFVKNMGIPLSTYIGDYYEKAFKEVNKCVKQPVGWNYRNETAATTWEVSFSAIKADRPAAADMLLMCSFLNYQGIPEKIFYDDSNFQEKMDAKSNINRLVSFSLAKRTVSECMTIHPVVHTWARERLSRAEKIKILQRLGQLYLTVSKRGISEDEIGFTVLSDEYNILSYSHMYIVGMHLQQQVFRPQTGEDQDQPTEAAISEVVRDDDFLRFAWAAAGDVTYHTGFENETDNGRAWHTSVIELCEKYRGKDDPSTLKAYRDMADFLLDYKYNDEALEYYNKALSICEKTHGDDHDITTEMRLSIGLFYYTQGRVDEGSKFYDLGLASLQKAADNDNRTRRPRIISAMGNKRSALMQGKMWQEALDCSAESLKLCESTVGKYHIETINVLGDAVEINCNMGRYEDAVKYTEIEIERREKAMGADDMDTLRTVYSLAMLHIRQAYRPKRTVADGKYTQEHIEVPNPAIISTAEKLLSGVISEMAKTTKEMFSFDFCNDCNEDRWVEAYLCLHCEADDASIPGTIICPDCAKSKATSTHPNHDFAYISKEGKVSKIISAEINRDPSSS